MPAESNGLIILHNKWYGNCKKRGHCRLNFLHQFCPSREGTQQYLLGLHQVECTLIRLQVIVFGGPIALHGLVHFLNTTGPSLTKVVYAYFDRISYVVQSHPVYRLSQLRGLISQNQLALVIFFFMCVISSTCNTRITVPQIPGALRAQQIPGSNPWPVCPASASGC